MWSGDGVRFFRGAWGRKFHFARVVQTLRVNSHFFQELRPSPEDARTRVAAGPGVARLTAGELQRAQPGRLVAGPRLGTAAAPPAVRPVVPDVAVR